MKFNKFAYISVLTTVICLTCPVVQSSNQLSKVNEEVDVDNLTNADLNHLLSLLEENGEESKTSQSDTQFQPPSNHGMDTRVPKMTPMSPTTSKPSKSPSASVIKPSFVVKKVWRKIRKPIPTTATPTTTTTTTTTTLPPTVTTAETTTAFIPEESLPIWSIQLPAPTEPLIMIPDFSELQQTPIQRREDTHMETLRNIAEPSQQDLVQQLSLLNSLLTSLGDNSTSDKTKITTTTPSSKISSDPKPSQPQPQVPQINNMQSLSLLNSMLASSSPADVAALSALLSLGAGGPSNIATRQTSTPPLGASDTEATAAINEFLKQAAAIEGQNAAPVGTSNKLDNFNGNIHDAAAASNQISSLLTILGSLNSLQQAQAQVQSQQKNPLLNFAQGNQNQLASQTSNAQINNNVLMSLIGNQRGQRQQQISASSLNDFFSQAQAQQSQSQGQGINLGSLLASASQNSPMTGFTTTGGNGLFSSLGTLGSSIISTVSNIFGGGGTPQVRGMDTRVGLGYRFGDAADAQIMWDVGPQLFTDKIQNEYRPSGVKTQPDNGETSEQIATKSRAEKQLQEMFAVKRQLTNEMEENMQNHHMYQRSFSTVPEPTKKPLSLLDIWNAGKEKVIAVKNTLFENPFGLLMPPAEDAPGPIIPFDDADLYQIAREKNMLKRSSAGYRSNRRRSKPRPKYEPIDDALSGHSTLTNYEKMLLSHGKDMGNGDVYASNSNSNPSYEEDEVKPYRRPGKWNQRRPNKPSPRPYHNAIPEDKEYGSRRRPTNRPRNPPRERDQRPNKPRRRRPSPPPSRWNNHRNQDERRRPQSNRPKTQPEPENDDGGYQDSPPQENRYNFNRERPNNSFNQHQQEPEPENDYNRGPPQFKNKPRDEYNNDGGNGQVESQNSPNNDFNGDDDRRPGQAYKDDYNDQRPYGNRNRPGNNNNRPSTRPHDDKDQGHYEDKHRPQYSRPSKQKNRQNSTHRRRNSGFSLSKIFNIFKGKSSARRRDSNNRPQPKLTSNRRNDFYKETSFDDPFNSFTDKNNDPIMSDSNDRFYARNRHMSDFENPMDTFNRKSSRLPPSRRGGVPLSELYEAVPDADVDADPDADSEVNPESNDSFIRRNAVAVNPKLREHEKQKLLTGDAYNASSPQKTGGKPHGQRKSVMSFVRNYLSKKSPRPTNPSSNTTRSPSTMSTLTKLLSNPSALNPLMILPIRRRKPQKTQNETDQATTKLTVVDGQLKIVNTTTEAEDEGDKPIVHIGEDMSFEELSKVFGAIKTKAKKGKKKLKIKIKKPDPRKDHDEDEQDQDEAEEKVDKAKSNLILSDDGKDDEDYEGDVGDEEPDKDDVKGIFIDIESGEVNVMKPVASLTSFEPKKEPSEEEIDDYEDEDGDGIADADMKRKQEIFSDIQKELKRNFNKMKKAQEKAEAKQRRKEALAEKGMDESMDVVSKYFDMIEEDEDTKTKTKAKIG